MGRASAHSGETPSGVRIVDRNGWLRITLPDAITMDNQGAIQCRIESVVTQGINIAIDLSQTRNMNSSAFGMIVRLKKIVDERQGCLVLVNASPRTMEALQGVGLHKLLTIHARGADPDFLT